VHRDLVADHVDRVRARHPPGTPTGDRLDAAVGDARRLDLDDASVDVTLLLGPLYHLPDLGDRLAALTEAARIVHVVDSSSPLIMPYSTNVALLDRRVLRCNRKGDPA
jgi:hypothetical protein